MISRDLTDYIIFFGMEKRARGRPKRVDTLLEPITLRLTEPMMRQIEAIQAGRTDGSDRSQVIRELLAKALEERK